MIDRGRGRLVALAFACGLAMAALGARASEGLSDELSRRIEAAAEAGHSIDDGIQDPYGTRLEHSNRALNAVVIEAIAAEPGLARTIVDAALAADPSDRAKLIEDVRAAYPWFWMPPPPTPAVEPDPIVESELAHEDFVLLAAEGNGVPYIPVEERPENWPILPEEGGPDGYADIDPLRPINIVFFYVNGTIDYILLEPLAKTFDAIVPNEVEAALGHAFDNLGAPVTFINDLLQLEFENAGITLARFVLNSTVGVAGLIDVAKEAGLQPHKADFGQTLHRYGVGNGIFLVLPIFGGTTLRDAVGLGFDYFVDPRGLVIPSEAGIGLGIGEAIVRRTEYIGPADFLEAYAQNHYDAARAWSYQRRERFLSAGCDQPSMIICVGDFSK